MSKVRAINPERMKALAASHSDLLNAGLAIEVQCLRAGYSAAVLDVRRAFDALLGYWDSEAAFGSARTSGAFEDSAKEVREIFAKFLEEDGGLADE